MFSKVQRQVCQKLTGLQQHARSVANITAKSQAVFDRESKYGAHNYHPYRWPFAKEKACLCGMWMATATTISSVLTVQ